MSTTATDTRTSFHLSLNVSSIDRSVEFFSRLFGMPPTKHRSDYAKFEVVDPPVTLSLEPENPAQKGALNHIGLKLGSRDALVEFQRQLEMRGLSSQREEGVECCYARQTKFWLHDPDANLWEVYVLDGHLEHRGAGQTEQALTGSCQKPDRSLEVISEAAPTATQPTAQSAAAADSVWSHRLGQPLQLPADIEPHSLDRVQLQGSFNAASTAEQRREFLTGLRDLLRPGGQLSLHCLTADRAPNVPIELAGPASVVEAVPVLGDLIGELSATGFQAMELTRYGSRPCFTLGAASLRETILVASTAPVDSGGDRVRVVYQGPCDEISIFGQKFRVGEPTEIPAATWKQIQGSGGAERLVELEQVSKPISCG